ncbi:general substrate transporter [Triangularia setosa]|uniref:General substrate transporter n=1 Tax=Triangularia setosa TaxID=2587417 RepID=A0AAN7A465_9PEZI|nr:general substrate transporter [Podospora setosa]
MSTTPPPHGKWLLPLTTSACSAGFLLFGYDQGVLSGIILSPSFLATMGYPSPLILGTLTALYDLGAVLGALLAALCSDDLGRKKTLLFGAALVGIAGLAMALSQDRIQFGIGRVVVGIGIGLVCSVCPVYQAEISRGKQRGWMVCCQLTTMLVGLAGAYWVNYGFYFAPGQKQWRVPLGLQVVFAGYILGLGAWLEETPRWLLRRFPDSLEKGREVLQRLRGEEEDVEEELGGIVEAIARESKAEGGWRDLVRDDGLKTDKRFYLAVGIQFMQQMTGINIVTYYAPTLYKTGLGMSEEKALLLGGFTQMWYVLASFVTWYTIDRVGRRKLLVSMAFGMGAVLIGEGLATAADSHLGAIMAVVCLFLLEGCFTWGWMACVWIYPPEILPLSIRAKGSALAAAADFIGNWIVVEVTPVGISTMGWTFYLVWAGFNLVNGIVVWLFYPETGGLALEAVDLVFTGQTGGVTGEDSDAWFGRLQWDRVRAADEAVRATRLGDGERQPLLPSSSAVSDETWMSCQDTR